MGLFWILINARGPSPLWQHPLDRGLGCLRELAEQELESQPSSPIVPAPSSCPDSFQDGL